MQRVRRTMAQKIQIPIASCSTLTADWQAETLRNCTWGRSLLLLPSSKRGHNNSSPWPSRLPPRSLVAPHTMSFEETATRRVLKEWAVYYLNFDKLKRAVQRAIVDRGTQGELLALLWEETVRFGAWCSVRGCVWRAVCATRVAVAGMHGCVAGGAGESRV